MDILHLIGRQQTLFGQDISNHSKELIDYVSQSSFLVIGAAGSIGKAVTLEIFRRGPKKLHAIDISENNLVELVREIRSSLGYIDGEFKTFAIDCGGSEFDALMNNSDGYDYVINLSALKHVRSEKDPFSLMRMLQTNIANTVSTLKHAQEKGAHKYFCVSTDKAANPVNMMGASKRLMEKFLLSNSKNIKISTARFANVAFSDGSLLHGFTNRLLQRQPISAPKDVTRYFVTPQEAGLLCLFSILLGDNLDTYFPVSDSELKLTHFTDIAKRFLHSHGYEVQECSSEDEARMLSPTLTRRNIWPVYFFDSDTTGEKAYEEFYTSAETVDFSKYKNIGVIKGRPEIEDARLNGFLSQLNAFNVEGNYNREDLIDLVKTHVPEFQHLEAGKFLDDKM